MRQRGPGAVFKVEPRPPQECCDKDCGCTAATAGNTVQCVDYTAFNATPDKVTSADNCEATCCSLECGCNAADVCTSSGNPDRWDKDGSSNDESCRLSCCSDNCDCATTTVCSTDGGLTNAGDNTCHDACCAAPCGCASQNLECPSTHTTCQDTCGGETAYALFGTGDPTPDATTGIFTPLPTGLNRQQVCLNLLDSTRRWGPLRVLRGAAGCHP